MTTGSLIVAAILVLLISGAIAIHFLERRSGKCSCGSDCGCCGSCCKNSGPVVPKE